MNSPNEPELILSMPEDIATERLIAENAERMKEVLDEVQTVRSKKRSAFANRVENQSVVGLAITDTLANTKSVIFDERNYDSTAPISLLRVVGDHEGFHHVLIKKRLEERLLNFVWALCNNIHVYSSTSEQRYSPVFFFDGPLEGKVLKEESRKHHHYRKSGSWTRDKKDPSMWRLQKYSPDGDCIRSVFDVVAEDSKTKQIVGIEEGKATLSARILDFIRHEDAAKGTSYMDAVDLHLVRAYPLPSFNREIDMECATVARSLGSHDRRAAQYIFETLNSLAGEQPDRQIIGMYVSNCLETERLGEGYEIAQEQKRNVTTLLVRDCRKLGFS